MNFLRNNFAPKQVESAVNLLPKHQFTLRMNCIITGGTKGIGRSTAHIFAKNGCNLAIVARDQAALDAFKEELENHYAGIQVLIFSADLSKKEAVAQFISFVQSNWQAVDVLVNNAGLFIQNTMLEEEEGLLEQMMQVNLYAPFQLSRAFAPMMIRQKRGYIFNVCSIASLQAYPDCGSYTTSKHALLGFSRSLRLELKDKGVKVTAVIPGATWTASWKGASLPPERLIHPDEVAKVIWNAWNTNPSTLIEEILLRPMLGDL